MKYINIILLLIFVLITGACGIKGKLTTPADSKMNRIYPYE